MKVDEQIQNLAPVVSEDNIPSMKRYFENQFAVKNGNYHFDTTGTIYGLGYGTKSNQNKYGHSVCKFADCKCHIINFLFNSYFKENQCTKIFLIFSRH